MKECRKIREVEKVISWLTKTYWHNTSNNLEFSNSEALSDGSLSDESWVNFAGLFMTELKCWYDTSLKCELTKASCFQ